MPVESSTSRRLDTLLNQMVSLRDTTAPFWRWLAQCCSHQTFPCSCGLKRSRQRHSFATVFPIPRWVSHLIFAGTVSNLVSLNFESSAVSSTLRFLRRPTVKNGTSDRSNSTSLATKGTSYSNAGDLTPIPFIV